MGPRCREALPARIPPFECGLPANHSGDHQNLGVLFGDPNPPVEYRVTWHDRNSLLAEVTPPEINYNGQPMPRGQTKVILGGVPHVLFVACGHRCAGYFFDSCPICRENANMERHRRSSLLAKLFGRG